MKLKLLLSVLIVLWAYERSMAQRTVTGKVTGSESGDTLPGVSILIKGTTNGTVTDLDGNYTINATAEDILVFSYVGYLKEEVEINGRTIIDMNLTPDISQLDEIVVVGYGTQRKSDVTGSVASVKTKELEELPINRVDQALQGRVPGVQIQNNDASPNARTTVRIRGANSLNGGNDPLIVIDGFQGGRLSTLNPNDIESIEVLKDASATAIYGSRGANGVILVTTKRGKKGKTKVTYNSFYSIHSLRRKLELLDAARYAETVNAHRTELGLGTVFTDSEIAGFRTNGGTDWQDVIFRDAFAQNHLLSISGANDNFSYYLSGNVVDQEGIVEGTSYNRFSVRSNVNAKLGSKLSFLANTYIARETDHPTNLNSFAGDNSGSPVFSAQLFSPTKSIFDDEGNYTQPGGGVGPPTNYNPLALAVEPIRDNFINTISFNANVEYEIIDGLKLSIGGAYRLRDLENNLYVNGKPTNSPGTEFSGITDQKFLTLQNTNLISYTKQISKDHNINITGVVEQQFEEFNENIASSRGFLTDAVTYNNLSLGANPQAPGSRRTSRSLLSYMGRINYGYKGRYLLTATARSDGSSVFGANNKRGFFPSVALGWNVSDENFLMESGSVSKLKIRASYGVVGNQAIAPYQSLSRLSTTTYVLNGTTASTGVNQASEAGNPDLKWEKTIQLNIGVDLELFGGRLNVIADYYKKNTEDLLLQVPLPRTSGVGSVLRNVGEVENKGVELYLGGVPVNRDLKWETGFNISINKNKVLALSGEDEITLGAPGLPNFGNTIFLEVGQPIGQLRGYVQNGIWKSSEASQAGEFGVVPGAPKYVDQNGDRQITSADIVTIGNTLPKFTFGWNNTLTYKNFNLNIFIQGVQGNDIYNLGRVRSERTSGDADATGVAILDRWTPQNENTDVPSFTGTNNHEVLQSSRWIEDGSYIRVKNIALGYYLSSSILDKLKIGSARIYITGTNLFTSTDYTGYDPESTTNVDTRGGIDLASFPSQKVFTVGLDLNF